MKILLLFLLLNALENGSAIESDGGETNPKIIKINPSIKTDSSSQRTEDLKDNVEQYELEENVEVEIESYHEIKKRIQFLEEHLRQHADFNFVETEDLVAAAETLKTIKRTIIQPLETNLIAVKGQIKKGDHNLSAEELHFVKSVLENADGFLKSSEERIQQLELIENDWDSQEESEKIRQAAESKLNQQKERKRIDVDAGTNPIVFRSKKLQKVKDLIFKKEKLKQMEMSSKSSINTADLHELKLRLDLEKAEDSEPGFAKKKITEALQKAAEMSQKFMDKKFPHGDHRDHIIIEPTEDESAPSWALVITLAAISSGLMIILLLMLCSRTKNTKPWKRNLFKTTSSSTRSGAYCELDEVQHQEKETPMTLTNLNVSSSPWIDNSWGDWGSEKRTQKLK